MAFRVVKALNAAIVCLRAVWIVNAPREIAQAESWKKQVNEITGQDWSYLQHCLGCSDTDSLPRLLCQLQTRMQPSLLPE